MGTAPPPVDYKVVHRVEDALLSSTKRRWMLPSTPRTSCPFRSSPRTTRPKHEQPGAEGPPRRPDDGVQDGEVHGQVKLL